MKELFEKVKIHAIQNFYTRPILCLYRYNLYLNIIARMFTVHRTGRTMVTNGRDHNPFITQNTCTIVVKSRLTKSGQDGKTKKPIKTRH